MRWPYAAILERSLTVSEAHGASAGDWVAPIHVRVLVISDIHAGPFVSCATLQRTFERLLTLQPDLILLPGDFATVSVQRG